MTLHDQRPIWQPPESEDIRATVVRCRLIADLFLNVEEKLNRARRRWSRKTKWIWRCEMSKPRMWRPTWFGHTVIIVVIEEIIVIFPKRESHVHGTNGTRIRLREITYKLRAPRSVISRKSKQINQRNQHTRDAREMNGEKKTKCRAKRGTPHPSIRAKVHRREWFTTENMFSIKNEMFFRGPHSAAHPFRCFRSHFYYLFGFACCCAIANAFGHTKCAFIADAIGPSLLSLHCHSHMRTPGVWIVLRCPEFIQDHFPNWPVTDDSIRWCELNGMWFIAFKECSTKNGRNSLSEFLSLLSRVRQKIPEFDRLSLVHQNWSLTSTTHSSLCIYPIPTPMTLVAN